MPGSDLCAESPRRQQNRIAAGATCQVLVADGHEDWRTSLRILINSFPHFNVMGECSSGRQAVKLALQRAPDILVIGSTISDLDYLDAIATLAWDMPRTRSVALGEGESEAVAQGALEAGACAFIDRARGIVDLEPALHAVAQGRRFISPALT